MELWTALIIGVAGSLHCIGMCGPIAVALPGGAERKWYYAAGRFMYNLGRVLTYAALGAVCGLVGKTIFMAGYQESLSIALGILILLALILPSKYGKYLTGAKLHEEMSLRLRSVWGRLMSKHSIGSLFIVGILNGFLPCGLVYVALAGAVATGSVLGGISYMTLFGLGTIPVMFAMALFGTLVGVGVKRTLRKLLPVGAVILAALFILRGMSLGIPYISPNLEMKMNEMGKTEVKGCCEPGAHEGQKTAADSTGN